MSPKSQLPETFNRVRRSIIAFASASAVIVEGERPPLLPTIIGTGFIVDERGIAITNRHVVEALAKLPPLGGHPKCFAMLFSEIISHGNARTISLTCVPLKRRFIATEVEASDPYFGQLTTDLAIVQLRVRDVPALQISEDEGCIRAGMPIATAGYPLGSDPLVVYGNVNQLTPTLRHGIVSGVFPFDVPHAHGFTIDVMSQGGASGSPIFDPESGVVVGVIHAGFPNTNITLAVPGWLAARAVSQLSEEVEWDFANTPTLDDYKTNKEPNSAAVWEPVASFPHKPHTDGERF